MAKSSRSEKEQAAKVEQYEEFLDKRLKPDLLHAIAQRNKVLEQQKTYSDLGKSIQMLEKHRLTKLRTMVNLGSEFYAQAEVPDASRIFVDVGLGFHVEFTWSEALQFLAVKEEMLSKQVDVHTQKIANIKAQIKLVYEGIRELMNFHTVDDS